MRKKDRKKGGEEGRAGRKGEEGGAGRRGGGRMGRKKEGRKEERKEGEEEGGGGEICTHGPSRAHAHLITLRGAGVLVAIGGAAGTLSWDGGGHSSLFGVVLGCSLCAVDAVDCGGACLWALGGCYIHLCLWGLGGH